MNPQVEKLLQPVSADQPSGADLAYDPRMDELETMLKGVPEVDVGTVTRPAEPPDWRGLEKASAAFLAESKHIRVALMYACSAIQMRGLPGFRDGMALIRGLVEQYWTSCYPLLDVEDNNDPTARLNHLATLNRPRGSVDSWLRVVDFLYAAPLCRPKGVAPVSLDLYQLAKKKDGGQEVPADVPDSARVSSMMRSAAPEDVSTNLAASREALDDVKALDTFLSTTLGSSNSISFDVLEETLGLLISTLEPLVGGAAAGAEAPTEAGAAAGSPAAAGGSTAIQVSGVIRSREDVVRTLDGILEYYRQVEPGSPVPLLLRRVQKLVPMDFVQAMQELNLATVDTLRPLAGSTLDTPPAA
jgi:type VI secretion system protein ImpA